MFHYKGLLHFLFTATSSIKNVITSYSKAVQQENVLLLCIMFTLQDIQCIDRFFGSPKHVRWTSSFYVTTE